MNPSAAPEFESVRQMAHVADGIRCHCQCADLPGYRSLLSCYESPGMAQFCDICRGEARVAYDLFVQGADLDSIRASVDARFG